MKQGGIAPCENSFQKDRGYAKQGSRYEKYPTGNNQWGQGFTICFLRQD